MGQMLPVVWIYRPESDPPKGKKALATWICQQNLERFLDEKFVDPDLGGTDYDLHEWDKYNRFPLTALSTGFDRVYYSVFQAIHVGDIVLYATARVTKNVYVSRVTSNYYFVPPRGRLGHRRNVSWLTNYPRVSFSKEALGGLGSLRWAVERVVNKVFLTELEQKMIADNLIQL